MGLVLLQLKSKLTFTRCAIDGYDGLVYMTDTLVARIQRLPACDLINWNMQKWVILKFNHLELNHDMRVVVTKDVDDSEYAAPLVMIILE